MIYGALVVLLWCNSFHQINTGSAFLKRQARIESCALLHVMHHEKKFKFKVFGRIFFCPLLRQVVIGYWRYCTLYTGVKYVSFVNIEILMGLILLNPHLPVSVFYTHTLTGVGSVTSDTAFPLWLLINPFSNMILMTLNLATFVLSLWHSKVSRPRPFSYPLSSCVLSSNCVSDWICSP